MSFIDRMVVVEDFHCSLVSIMDYIQSEPFVVYVANKFVAAVVSELSIVHSDHTSSSMPVLASEYLHDVNT